MVSSWRAALRGRPRRSFSTPRQDPLPPGVGKPEKEDADEGEHADEQRADVDAGGSEDDRPEVDEDDLDVEGDEQERVDVERQPEAAVGVAVGVNPRFVGQALVDVAAVSMGDQPRGSDRQEDERDAGDHEPHDVPDVGHVDGYSGWAGGSTEPGWSIRDWFFCARRAFPMTARHAGQY